MAVGDLLESGEYELPPTVTVVGVGLGSIKGGLEMLKAGVSGTNLVVYL
jgi:hypothetical protein